MKISFSFSKCFCCPVSPDVFTDTNKLGEQTLQKVYAFSYSELKIATNGFNSSNKIGEGGFGSVYKGKLQDGTIVAVKVLSAESTQGDKEFMSEIVSMSNIRGHTNLVKLHGGCIHGLSRILVYDYMENNSLSKTLLGGENKRRKFGWNTRRKICLEIARGIAYLHEEIKPHIVHRDIKASNILLDHNFTPKIADFGLSKLFPQNITHISTRVAGTLGYLAPEYAMNGHLTRKIDVYSFGVLLLEIMSGSKVVDFDLQLGEQYLVDKAWDMYKSNSLLELMDPMLHGDFPEIEAARFLKIGLLCVQEIRGLRPRMSTIIKIMNDEINIINLQISKPGVISNIMDVKIDDERPPSSESLNSMQSPQFYPSSSTTVPF